MYICMSIKEEHIERCAVLYITLLHEWPHIRWQKYSYVAI